MVGCVEDQFGRWRLLFGALYMQRTCHPARHHVLRRAVNILGNAKALDFVSGRMGAVALYSLVEGRGCCHVLVARK
eukprot:24875-Eustigmatos_ZCMA.PRE.1